MARNLICLRLMQQRRSLWRGNSPSPSCFVQFGTLDIEGVGRALRASLSTPLLVLLGCDTPIFLTRVTGHSHHSTPCHKDIPCARLPTLYETSGPLALSFDVVHVLHPGCPQPWSRHRLPRPCQLLRRRAPSCLPLPRCLRARRWPHDEHCARWLNITRRELGS